MRPQNRYYLAEDYLEIDVDIYLWAYLARRTLCSMFTRLNHFVLDFAIVLQVRAPRRCHGRTTRMRAAAVCVGVCVWCSCLCFGMR